MATPVSRVHGLGSAREGAREWWLSRLTSVALVPLTIWWVVSLLDHTGTDYAEYVTWLRNPVPAVLMIVTLAVAFYHIALGLQVVIEDYVHHEAAKLGSLILVKFGCALAAVAGIFSVLRIAFGG